MNILDSLIAEKPCKFDINQNNNNNQEKEFIKITYRRKTIFKFHKLK